MKPMKPRGLDRVERAMGDSRPPSSRTQKQAPRSTHAKPTGAPQRAAVPTGPANAWLIQSPPGLAMIMKKELVRAGAIERKQTLLIKRQRNHDLMFVSRVKSEAGFTSLRIAESVMQCPVFGRYKISQTQLQSLVTVLQPLGPRRLVVQVAGKVFDRRDIQRWLEKEIDARGYTFNEDVEDEVWMICIDESYYFGIPRFKSRHLADREEREEEREGSLPPSIAAAMAFAAQPKDTDVVLDPVCGSGTLLAEVHAYAPGAKRTGVDIDANAVKVAKANLRPGDGELIAQGDSRTLSTWLKAKENHAPDVTLMLANFPFGKQYGDRATNTALYRDILRESLAMARTPEARTAWRAVVLTSDIESLAKAVDGFTRQDLFRVKIRGEMASAVLLRPSGVAPAAPMAEDD